MTDDEIQKLTDKIIEHLRVQHLEVKPTDTLVVEMDAMSMTPVDSDKLISFLSATVTQKLCFVMRRPGSDPLRYTVLSKEKADAL